MCLCPSLQGRSQYTASTRSLYFEFSFSPCCGLSTYDLLASTFTRSLREKRKRNVSDFTLFLLKKTKKKQPGQIPDAVGFSFLGKKTKQSSTNRQTEPLKSHWINFPFFFLHAVFSLRGCKPHRRHQEFIKWVFTPALNAQYPQTIIGNSLWHIHYLMDKHAWACGCCLSSPALCAEC